MLCKVLMFGFLSIFWWDKTGQMAANDNNSCLE